MEADQREGHLVKCNRLKRELPGISGQGTKMAGHERGHGMFQQYESVSSPISEIYSINSQYEILLLYSEVGAESLWLLRKACKQLWEVGFPESRMC